MHNKNDDSDKGLLNKIRNNRNFKDSILNLKIFLSVFAGLIALRLIGTQLILTAIFLSGIYFFYKSIRKYNLKEMIGIIPTSKIRGIPMGIVEMRGKAVAQKGKAFIAPLTNKECVYYRVEASFKRKHTSTIYSERKQHFYLKDETGAVLLSPKNCKFDIKEKFYLNCKAGSIPPEARIFLNSMGVVSSECDNVKITEYHIAANDMLYVIGTAADNPFKAESSSKRGYEDIMICRGQEGIYFISDNPEKKFLSSIKIYISIYMCLGFILTIGSMLAFFWSIGLL